MLVKKAHWGSELGAPKLLSTVSCFFLVAIAISFSVQQKKSQHGHPKGCQHWLNGSGLLVVNYDFFMAPRTVKRKLHQNCGAGYDFRLRLPATLRAENITAVVCLHVPSCCFIIFQTRFFKRPRPVFPYPHPQQMAGKQNLKRELLIVIYII